LNTSKTVSSLWCVVPPDGTDASDIELVMDGGARAAIWTHFRWKTSRQLKDYTSVHPHTPTGKTGAAQKSIEENTRAGKPETKTSSRSSLGRARWLASWAQSVRRPSPADIASVALYGHAAAETRRGTRC
jgi:hypothetical protein